MVTTTKRVVIIVPTYNEKGNIEKLVSVLVEDIFPLLDQKYQVTILVVDDSSPDGTGEIVRGLKTQYPDLELLSNTKKMGLGNAYIRGMEFALTKLKAEVIFQFDADLQHDPEKIPPMLEKIDQGYDLVLGSRYIPGGGIPENWGLYRKFLSIVGNLTIRIVITKFDIHDWTTGYRALKAKVVETILPELNEERFMGYTFQIGFLHKAVRRGFKVAEVPFVFRDRKLGRSKLGAEYIKNTLLYILKVRAKEIVVSRIFKFVVVGTVGALVQLSTLQIFRTFLPYLLAFFLSIELAVGSNFILSNLWTFSDRKLKLKQAPFKFIQFNLASFGSILIQQILAFMGEKYIGLFPLFTIPVVFWSIDTGLMFAVVGILLGMMWNFFAYSRIVWKKS